MKLFIKFGFLSGGGWLLDCFLLLVLTEKIGITLTVANFVSSSVAAVSVFAISKLIVFRRHREHPNLLMFLYFIYTCAVIFFASIAIKYAAWLVLRIANLFSVSFTVVQLSFFAKVLITPPQLLANFFMSRFLVEHRGQCDHDV
jgi:putative flippase GtrA